MNTSDVLIIGAGGAGLVAALHAKAKGVHVRVLTKRVSNPFSNLYGTRWNQRSPWKCW
ncbi:MAG: FAD-binding protein [Sulfurimonas sp.]|nr:FAD-binding protein [Sulfurimonas sp.]